ncbi:MAG: tyrosine-type recombinase/integrase [Gemmataceae bacterium]
MAQSPKLRKKKIGKSVYWFTKAGGETYFGNVNDVTYSDARRLFREHMNRIGEAATASKRKELTAGELMDLFLEWIRKHRSDRTYSTRLTNCSRFGSFVVNGQRICDLPATKIKGADLEAWLEHLEKNLGLSPTTRLHAETSIKHCWNWATKHPSPTPHVTPTYRPFSGVERTHVPLRPLTEADLLTDEEIQVLFKAAEIDLDQFHRFGPKTPRANNPYSSFADMLRCYYHTGARTGELASCEVGDVLFKTQQVVLGKHKRSRTQRTPTIRHITLNDEAMEIFKRHCEGKQLTDSVFFHSDGKPWARRTVPNRFDRIKEIVAEQELGKVRPEITIYDFRHLWISEALMAGNDIATVARMAGTSIAMIERVYGHFRNDHLQEAQRRLDEARKLRRS